MEQQTGLYKYGKTPKNYVQSPKNIIQTSKKGYFMRPYMLLKVKEEKLPSGRQVETFRWDFAGIISFMFLTFLGHFFFGLLSFAILKLFGPVYEFYSAWIIENPKHLLLLKKRVRQYTMETNLNLNKLDSHEEKEWTQIL